MDGKEILDPHSPVLTDGDRDILRKLGALNWSEKDIAGYFGFDPLWFHEQWTNPDSEISRLVRQGGLQERAKVEMFYGNRNVSRDALRAKAADQYDALYHLALDAAKTTKDYEIASGILTQKSRVLNLDKEDPVQLPPQQYQKQYRLLSLSPESIGLPPANRDELARQIDSMTDIPETERERLRMEASIDDMDIVKVLENVTQEEGQ